MQAPLTQHRAFSKLRESRNLSLSGEQYDNFKLEEGWLSKKKVRGRSKDLREDTPSLGFFLLSEQHHEVWSNLLLRRGARLLQFVKSRWATTQYSQNSCPGVMTPRYAQGWIRSQDTTKSYVPLIPPNSHHPDHSDWEVSSRIGVLKDNPNQATIS